MFVFCVVVCMKSGDQMNKISFNRAWLKIFGCRCRCRCHGYEKINFFEIEASICLCFLYFLLKVFIFFFSFFFHQFDTRRWICDMEHLTKKKIRKKYSVQFFIFYGFKKESFGMVFQSWTKFCVFSLPLRKYN